MDDLLWLQAWYARQCDGEWEHRYGVRIETLDNPGWRLQVDLLGTALAGQPFAPISIEQSERDWLACHVHDDLFEGAGDPRKLPTLLAVFHVWAEGVYVA